MKYFAVGFCGLLLGVTAACALLYFNPLTTLHVSSSEGEGRVLRYALPDDALHFTAGERLMLPIAARGEDSFWEETIDRSALLAVVLRDDAGVPAAIATRLMAASTATDLLLKGALVSDYWLLTVPGEGTLFVRTDTNLWPFLKNTVVPVWYFGRPWKGPTEVEPTMGPGPDGTGVTLGGTGRFASADGTAVERYTLTALDRATSQVAASGELDLRGLDAVVASGD